MAIREVRIRFDCFEDEAFQELNSEVGLPFEFYFDLVMRGRFKNYSGTEVKGINIVNLICGSERYYDKYLSVHGDDWKAELNAYNLRIPYDLSQMKGTQEEKLLMALKLFESYAVESDLPQIQKLCEDLNESYKTIDINQAIANAKEYHASVMQAWLSEQGEIEI